MLQKNFMKEIKRKIKNLSSAQAILIGSLIIAFAYLVSNNTSTISNIFCNEKCRETKYLKAINCAKQSIRRAHQKAGEVRNDIYKKCLKSY